MQWPPAEGWDLLVEHSAVPPGWGQKGQGRSTGSLGKAPWFPDPVQLVAVPGNVLCCLARHRRLNEDHLSGATFEGPLLALLSFRDEGRVCQLQETPQEKLPSMVQPPLLLGRDRIWRGAGEADFVKPDAIPRKEEEEGVFCEPGLIWAGNGRRGHTWGSLLIRQGQSDTGAARGSLLRSQGRAKRGEGCKYLLHKSSLKE